MEGDVFHLYYIPSSFYCATAVMRGLQVTSLDYLTYLSVYLPMFLCYAGEDRRNVYKKGECEEGHVRFSGNVT